MLTSIYLCIPKIREQDAAVGNSVRVEALACRSFGLLGWSVDLMWIVALLLPRWGDSFRMLALVTSLKTTSSELDEIVQFFR